MLNAFARNAAPAPAGGVLGVDLDDEVDLGDLDIDDEELRHDIEEQASQGNGAGLFATLMQLITGGRGGDAQDTANNDSEDEGELEGVPGSWPEDEADNHNGHAPNN